MDCFGTYFTHAQTCDVTRLQSATQWTASVHTLHMPKPDVTRVTRYISSFFLVSVSSVRNLESHETMGAMGNSDSTHRLCC